MKNIHKYSTYYMNPDFLNAIEIFLKKFGIAYSIEENLDLLTVEYSTITDVDTKLAYDFLIFDLLDCRDFEYNEE